MYKSVIFDLDGTLLDSMSVWEDVDKIFLKENNVYDADYVSDIVKKMCPEESAQFFIDEFNLPHNIEYVIKRIEKIVEMQYAQSIQLKPYVIDYLEYLRINNIPCCIATATYKSLAEKALKRLEILHEFQFILTCSEIGKGKTSPDVYLEAAKKIGTQPKYTAVVEDALHCAKTASNAGFYTIGVYDKTSKDDWNKMKKICDKTITSFKELL